MCVEAATLALAGKVVSAGFGILDANRQASEQESAFRVRESQAHDQLRHNYLSMTIRQATEADAANQRIQRITQDGDEAIAIAQARIAESGVSGASAADIINEFERDKGAAIAAELKNRQLTETNIQLEKQGLNLRTEAGILGSVPTPVQGPDLIGSALDIGLSGFDVFFGAGDDDGLDRITQVNTGG